ncbi:MAG TPA: dephospho-CoA kinase [Polyangiales bacterium]|nr:dephospho-CoA kinase [Polyangiales bacterium]
MTVPVVGLTGGIASGKSTVARAFALRGIPVVDADQLAREVVAPGSEGLAAVVREFGDDVLLSDGNLDRKAVAARVFADPTLRVKLQSILHPRIGQLSQQRLAEVPRDKPYAIYEAPLIVESGLHHGMQALIVVAIAPELQIERVMARDGRAREDAEARLRAQAPLERKLAAATYVIDNGRALSELDPQVDAVHAKILSALGGSTR